MSLNKSTVELLWHACHTLWESHNKRIHGNNPQEAERLLKQKLSTKICLLHNRRSECMPDSTKLFHPQLSPFLQKSTSVQLQNWLNLYGPAIIDSIATRKSESVLNPRPRTKYFKTTSATSTRPRTRHRRTLKPRFNSKIHAPKITKSKHQLPPVRYTARITRWLLTDELIPLIPPLQLEEPRGLVFVECSQNETLPTGVCLGTS
jgi:hypothetical protein